MTPSEAYEQALYNQVSKDSRIIEYQEQACGDPRTAYRFAEDILIANIPYCQKRVCDRDDYYSYYFAKEIPEADIEYCYNHSYEYKSFVTEFILKEL